MFFRIIDNKMFGNNICVKRLVSQSAAEIIPIKDPYEDNFLAHVFYSKIKIIFKTSLFVLLQCFDAVIGSI